MTVAQLEALLASLENKDREIRIVERSAIMLMDDDYGSTHFDGYDKPIECIGAIVERSAIGETVYVVSREKK